MSYESTGTRDPIWTRVDCDPEDGLASVVRDQDSPSRPLIPKETQTSDAIYAVSGKQGLNVVSAAVFIAGEMAGSGVLALPRAIVNSGWIGFVLLIVSCFNAGYGGTKLGECWDIIEERYAEHRGRTRNPYATIAHRAYGPHASRLVSACVQVTLFGAGTVYLLLASQIVQQLASNVALHVGFCAWFPALALLVAPVAWYGSPKEFTAVGVGALLTTACACALIFSQIVMDGLHGTTPSEAPPPPRRTTTTTHGFGDFFASFGTILFAFGGASTFPTIQNDMEDKGKFSKSVAIGFTVILALYVPVSVGGFLVYGDAVGENVTSSLSRGALSTLADVLMAVHLVLAFLIVLNPVFQELEETFRVPRRFGPKRCVLRTLTVVIIIFVGESVPSFGTVLSLVGGSTITLMTFVLPPIFYMKLCRSKDETWPERQLPLHVKVYLWELVLLGIVGGSAATYTAFGTIFGHDSIAAPCYIRASPK